MFRLMGNIYKDTRIQKSTVICDDTKNSRTKKVFHCLDCICHEFDLPSPYGWMPTSKTFRNFQSTVSQDNFIEILDFDYLELQIIEED